MLWKRIVTSILLVPIVWASAWFPQSPIPWFTLVILVWALGALYEFYRIVNNSGKCRPPVYLGMALASLIIVQPLFRQPELTWLSLTLVVTVPLVFVMLQRDKSIAFVCWSWTLAGIMYLGWLASHYIALRGLDYGREWIIFSLFITFISDSSAYFIGRSIGRHKLASAISPHKTWEGSIGGIFGAALASFALQWWLNLPIGYGSVAVLAVTVSAVGQIGDLVESLFKRNAGAKDSSHVLPGHGGFLDRIDSVVFAGLVVYYYVLFSHLG